MHEVIRITEAEFKNFRPLNGHIVIRGEQDVTKIMVGGNALFFDGSFTPENNQVVVNRVIKVPEEDYIGDTIRSEILLSVGDLVWVNYFSVLQAGRIEVILETAHVPPLRGAIAIEEYRIVPYRQCYMGLSEGEEGLEYTMLNDYMLLTPVTRTDPNPLVLDHLKVQTSKRFYTVERAPFYGSFEYTNDHYPPVPIKPGDIVFLLDGNQFKLEHWPHYLYDKIVHYVTRVQKIMAVVDCVDEEADVF